MPSIISYQGDLFNGMVAVIHFFKVYMEQVIFDSSYLLIPATFLEDLKGILFI